MSVERLFGTDGIRGRAGLYPLDPETLWRIGTAIGQGLPGPFLVVRDPRSSGLWIEDLLCRALQKLKAKVKRAGVLTTPALSYLTRESGFGSGIMISASHNPYHDNGIKIFKGNGRKLRDDEERELERLIAEVQTPPRMCVHEGSDGLLIADPPIEERYLDFLARSCGKRLDSIHMVLDCANGASFRLAFQAFHRLGARVTPINASPDGVNINRDCGALFPQGLAEQTVGCGASLGAAFDGDADRVVFSTSEGNLLDGDHVLLALGEHFHDRGELEGDTVVTTVMANMGLEEALGRKKIRTLRTAVGDRRVSEAMQQGGYVLGGEQSGHIILSRYLSCGDGILTALKLAELTVDEPELPRRIFTSLIRYPQVTVNQPVSKKPDFWSIASIGNEIRRVEGVLGEKGRLVVRYSGTEPKVRIMVEGPPGMDLEKYAGSIAERFADELG